MTEPLSPKDAAIRKARNAIGDAIGRQSADTVLDAISKAGLVIGPAPQPVEAAELETVAELHELLAKATQGEWTNRAHGTFVHSKFGNVCACGDPHASTIVGYTECDFGDALSQAVANARLISTLQNAAPALLAIASQSIEREAEVRRAANLEVARKILEVSMVQADEYRREASPESERLACAAGNTGCFILTSLGLHHAEIKQMADEIRALAQQPDDKEGR